jgi:hypothetical protein
VVNKTARAAGIKFKRPSWGGESRASQMEALYRNGYTLEQIGEQYGVTRQRIQQVLKEYGLSAKDGGVKRRSQIAKDARARKRDLDCYSKWGCSRATYRKLLATGRDGGTRPTHAFASQKKNAQKRKIGWQLTLGEWWDIWEQSGRWAERGRGQGFVMCRVDDEGPYARGNVFIAPARENNSQRKGKVHDLPMGVRPHGQRFLAQRMFNGVNRRLGLFETPELAHAAYLTASPQVRA